MESGANRTAYFKELGPDLSGPNTCKCSCKQCADKALSELTTRYKRVFAHCDTDQLIAEIKRARTRKAIKHGA
jgi:hypothetical protein